MKKTLALLITVVLAFMLFGCEAKTETSSETILGQETTKALENESSSEMDEDDYVFEDEIVIGRVVPETGTLKNFGDGTPFVEQLAIDEINERGGIVIDGKRCRLKLLCRNSNSTLTGARRAAWELIVEGIDVMIVSNTDDTVSPVSAICEREGIACISVDAPVSAWLMGGPYKNSWHTFFDNEREMLCFYDVWEQIDSNKKIGLITANDTEGVEISTFIHDFAATKGYSIYDYGSYFLGQKDYSDWIEYFKEKDCDIILGVMVSADFKTFWSQLNETDYKPKMCTIAKACLFEEDIEELGEIGDGLITEVWWTQNFPYASSISGITSKELSEIYENKIERKRSEVPVTVGYKYANIEILYDILKRAGTLDLDTINKCAEETNLNTIIGKVSFNEDHVSLMPCVAGQWILNGDGTFHREIVGNYLIPNLEKTAKVKLLD